MWLLKRLICLIRDHVFAAIHVQEVSYQYCLRCGSVEAVKVHTRQGR